MRLLLKGKLLLNQQLIVTFALRRRDWLLKTSVCCCRSLLLQIACGAKIIFCNFAPGVVFRSVAAFAPPHAVKRSYKQKGAQVLRRSTFEVACISLRAGEQFLCLPLLSSAHSVFIASSQTCKMCIWRLLLEYEMTIEDWNSNRYISLKLGIHNLFSWREDGFSKIELDIVWKIDFLPVFV